MTKQYGNSKKYQQRRKAKMSGEKVAMSRVPSTLKVGWDILKSTKKSAKNTKYKNPRGKRDRPKRELPPVPIGPADIAVGAAAASYGVTQVNKKKTK